MAAIDRALDDVIEESQGKGKGRGKARKLSARFVSWATFPRVLRHVLVSSALVRSSSRTLTSFLAPCSRLIYVHRKVWFYVRCCAGSCVGFCAAANMRPMCGLMCGQCAANARPMRGQCNTGGEMFWGL